MKQPLFAIYDVKAEIYLNAWPARTAAMAIREFEKLVHDEEHPVGANPLDYSLWRMGAWDDENGLTADNPTLIVNGKDVLQTGATE